ncbi:hypothetical protein HOF65_04910 [bacterium]|nr:hypothetical protein [bacterium]
MDKILDKLLLGGKIFRVKDWILMVNFLKNQNIDNPSVRTGVNRIIKASPSYFWEALGRVYGECVDAPTYLTLLNLTLLNFTLLNSTSTLLSENKPSNFSNFKEESFEYSISKIFLQDLINRQVASVLYSLKTKSEDDIIQIWASEVSRMLRVDKLTPDQVRYVVEFTIQDDFRSTVILSMMKFRKKNSDKIPYFVVII